MRKGGIFTATSTSKSFSAAARSAYLCTSMAGTINYELIDEVWLQDCFLEPNSM